MPLAVEGQLLHWGVSRGLWRAMKHSTTGRRDDVSVLPSRAKAHLASFVIGRPTKGRLGFNITSCLANISQNVPLTSVNEDVERES